MVVVADASVAIRGDLSGFHKGIRQAEVATGNLGNRLRDALSFKNVLKTGAIFGIGTTLPTVIGNAIGSIGDMSTEFQNLERATRSVDDIFGESAGTIRNWGEAAAEAAGLSKREVAESAAILGSMLQNVGFDAATSADEVVKLQQRGSDLAATYGGEAADAINAVGSLLRGEFDTIEKYGVKIKQADVNARLLALGLDTSTNEAKRNAEAVAALSIFYDQTGASAGRFSENLDTLSGKLDANQAKIDNFMASLGEGVAGFQLGFIEDAEQLGGSFQDMGDAWNRFAINFGSQHVEVLAAADALGIDYGVLADRVIQRSSEMGESVETALAAIVAAGGHYMPLAIQQSGANWEAYTTTISDAMFGAEQEVASGAQNMATTAGDVPGMMADELLANQFELTGPEGAIAELVNFMDQALSPLEERFNARAFLASEELAAGLASGTPAVRRKAEEMRDKALAVLNVDWSVYGYNLGSTYADGMGRAIPLVEGAARGIASATGRQIGIESEPKAPDSPLRGITRWGHNVVRTYAEGILAELGSLDRAASTMAGRVIPGHASVGIPPASLSSGAAGGGVTVQIDARSVVPRSAVELKEIGERVGPAIDKYLVHRGRLPRRGSEGGM